MRRSSVSATINVGGRLVSLDEPQVMGILNVTPDSFFATSRCRSEEEIRQRDHQDITRPIAPLKQARDAILVDTSNMTINEVITTLQRIIKEKIPV